MSPADDSAPFPRISPESGLPIETEEEFLAAVAEGIAAADAGRTIPFEDIRTWIDSLGTDHPLPRPRCR